MQKIKFNYKMFWTIHFSVLFLRFMKESVSFSCHKCIAFQVYMSPYYPNISAFLPRYIRGSVTEISVWVWQTLERSRTVPPPMPTLPAPPPPPPWLPLAPPPAPPLPPLLGSMATQKQPPLRIPLTIQGPFCHPSSKWEVYG